MFNINVAGSAETDGRLKIGDQLMEVNSKPIYPMSHIAITDYLKSCGERVSISIGVTGTIFIYVGDSLGGGQYHTLYRLHQSSGYATDPVQ